jgi:predicted transcriptional regulator
VKRVNAFLILLIISLAALIAATAIGFTLFASNQNPYNWMSQMWGGSGSNYGGMGGMMGETGTVPPTNNPALPYFGALFAILIGLTVVGVVGIGYYLLYPQIRVGTVGVIQTTQNIAATQPVANGISAYESVTKTLTEDERKIVEVLNVHDGKYLQKYIRSETGLSRLQTHRIIARLADRGIVSLEKIGNTNQVYLSSWLQQKN